MSYRHELQLKQLKEQIHMEHDKMTSLNSTLASMSEVNSKVDMKVARLEAEVAVLHTQATGRKEEMNAVGPCFYHCHQCQC